MTQFSMKAEYERGVQDERRRIIELIESVDPVEFALAGELTGADIILMILGNEGTV